MIESNKDKFIEDVKVLLSGNIADKNTVDYLSFKIGRLFVQYLDQYLIDMGERWERIRNDSGRTKNSVK